MDNFSVFLRLTYNYVDSHNHHEKWRFIADLRITPRTIEFPSKTRAVATRFCRLPAHIDRATLIRAIEDCATAVTCACEYDCCDCLMFSTRVYPYKGRQVRIVTTTII